MKLYLGQKMGAGLYPAVFLSSFRPSAVVQGSGFGTRRFRSSALRKGLIVFQFAISIFLFIGMGVVYQQTEYFQNTNLGFDREQVIVVKNADLLQENKLPFKEKLLQYPNIEQVSVTSSLPGRGTSLRFVTPEGTDEGIVLSMLNCDQDFAKALKLKMAEGRFFSKDYSTDNRAVVINQEAALQMGWNQPIGKTIRTSSENYTVIGVLEDFHYSSMHDKIDKMGFLYTGTEQIEYADLFAVRVRSSDIQDILQIIKGSWESFSPSLPLDYSFLDQDYARLYAAEMRMKNIAAAFSILAILVSSMGLFGLAAFTAEQRRKEFGVRKILGASIPDILVIMNKEFLRWVVIANAAAWPIAYLVTRQWLQNFAYRISVRIEVFLLSGLFALIIAGLTVSYQSIKAAAANPVDSLRYE
jgi:putative ABC transport system permease protein